MIQKKTATFTSSRFQMFTKSYYYEKQLKNDYTSLSLTVQSYYFLFIDYYPQDNIFDYF